MGRRELEEPPARRRASTRSSASSSRSGRRHGLPLRRCQDDPARPTHAINRGGQPITFREYRPPHACRRHRRLERFQRDGRTRPACALREAAGVEVPGADSSCCAWPPIWSRSCRSIGSCFARSAVSNGPGSPRRSSPSSARGSSCSGRSSISASSAPKPKSASSNCSPITPRAHLSRYTALYTSLSTTYDFQLPNVHDARRAVPHRRRFPNADRSKDLTPVDFQRYDDVRLVGLPISSNSTGMVHSEQMHTLDGPIRLGKSAALGGRANREPHRSWSSTASASSASRPTTS